MRGGSIIIKDNPDYFKIMKKCTKCEKQKDFSCFSKNKKAKDGYNWWCKDYFF